MLIDREKVCQMLSNPNTNPEIAKTFLHLTSIESQAFADALSSRFYDWKVSIIYSQYFTPSNKDIWAMILDLWY